MADRAVGERELHTGNTLDGLGFEEWTGIMQEGAAVSHTWQKDKQMDSTYGGWGKQNVWGVIGSKREWQKLIPGKYTWNKSKKSYVTC